MEESTRPSGISARADLENSKILTQISTLPAGHPARPSRILGHGRAGCAGTTTQKGGGPGDDKQKSTMDGIVWLRYVQPYWSPLFGFIVRMPLSPAFSLLTVSNHERGSFSARCNLVHALRRFHLLSRPVWGLRKPHKNDKKATRKKERGWCLTDTRSRRIPNFLLFPFL